MKAKIYFFFLLLLCSGFIKEIQGVSLLEDSHPIMIQLNPLKPLYLAPFIHQTDFPDSYIKQLEEILAFDLNHNGETYLVQRSSSNDQLLTSENFENLGQAKDWKAQQVFYVVKARIHHRTLSALMLSIENQNLKGTDMIPLSGDLSRDRRQIHKLADTIHQALFGTEGIASTRILYTIKTQASQGNAKWASEVWEVDFDGHHPHQVTTGNHYCVTPVYIPPKPGYMAGGFLYVSYQIGQPKIYMSSLQGGTGQRLIYLRGNQLMPTISPQRDKIAFISDVTGNPDLFLQLFNPEVGTLGKPQQIFSARQATQGSPTFSPDGKRIAFVSDKDGSPRIYVMDIPEPGSSLSTIKAILISKQNRENSAPCWSPDGSKIAYCARTSGDRQIWMYDFATHQERPLTQGPGNKENPSWAPNSLHLVFNSGDAQTSELYIINLNQPDMRQITFGEGEKRFPNWGSYSFSSSQKNANH